MGIALRVRRYRGKVEGLGSAAGMTGDSDAMRIHERLVSRVLQAQNEIERTQAVPELQFEEIVLGAIVKAIAAVRRG